MFAASSEPAQSSGRRLRLGILGAARHVPFSVIEPLQSNPDLRAKLDVVGIASLDGAEAEVRARAWDILRPYTSFEDLLADPHVDAVYNVLPTAVRGHWTVRALLAGKHVLSETPIASNAREALAAQRAAEDSRRVLLEGTHPRCHPVTARARQMVLENRIGMLEHIDLRLGVGHGLTGRMVCSQTGALMSLGCHGIAILRELTGEFPRVLSAHAEPSRQNPGVDSAISCSLKMPGGAVVHMACSVAETSAGEPTLFVITGSEGCIRVKEWFTGQGKSSNEIGLRNFSGCGEESVERMDTARTRDTFYFQWTNFVQEVRTQERRKEDEIGLPWAYGTGNGPTDAVLNLAVIDQIYRSAGLEPWSTKSPPPAPYDRLGHSKL